MYVCICTMPHLQAIGLAGLDSEVPLSRRHLGLQRQTLARQRVHLARDRVHLGRGLRAQASRLRDLVLNIQYFFYIIS